MAELLKSLDFTGKRVLIAGGGRGIGRVAVKMFLELNAEVVVLDIEDDLLQKLKADFPAAKGIKVDLRDWNGTRQALESVLPIHHLVNSAGMVEVKSFLDTTEEQINWCFELFYKAVVNVSQVVAKDLIRRGEKGTIVNMGCASAKRAVPGVGDYTAFKAALAILTKTMGLELAPHGIRVNNLRTAVANTESIQQLPQDLRQHILGPILSKFVLTEKEPVETEEVVKGIIFLSSPLSAMMTGSSMTVDAGFSIH